MNTFVGTSSSLAQGYDTEVGHCIILDTTVKNTQCTAVDSGDT